MRYIIEIQDLVANAFIESNEKRFLSYKEIEEYGANAVRKLNAKGYNAILSLSSDFTKAFLVHYSDFFIDKKEGRCYGIALKDGVTIEDLMNEFCDVMPLELFKALVDAEALNKLAESEKAEIDSNMLWYIADHNDSPVDFVYAIHNAANADFDDATLLKYLHEVYGYCCSDEELENAVAKFREEHA